MKNNYTQILEMSEKFGYTELWVRLQFIQRKKDTGKDNRILKKQYTKIRKIDLPQVIQYCEENQCRCYLTFIDDIIEGGWKALESKVENLDTWMNSGINDVTGLHLIDVDGDNTTKIPEILEWLKTDQYCIIPSRSGVSLVFYGKSDVAWRYWETEFNEFCSFHMSATMNLYIPDFSISLNMK